MQRKSEKVRKRQELGAREGEREREARGKREQIGTKEEAAAAATGKTSVARERERERDACSLYLETWKRVCRRPFSCCCRRGCRVCPNRRLSLALMLCSAIKARAAATAREGDGEHEHQEKRERTVLSCFSDPPSLLLPPHGFPLFPSLSSLVIIVCVRSSSCHSFRPLLPPSLKCLSVSLSHSGESLVFPFAGCALPLLFSRQTRRRGLRKEGQETITMCVLASIPGRTRDRDRERDRRVRAKKKRKRDGQNTESPSTLSLPSPTVLASSM